MLVHEGVEGPDRGDEVALGVRRRLPAMAGFEIRSPLTDEALDLERADFARQLLASPLAEVLERYPYLIAAAG